MKYTITLDEKTFPITDIRNIHFDMDKKGGTATLDIKTEAHGDFHQEASLADKDAFNSLWALKTDVIATLKAIADGRLSVE
jgi:hypothetical protein